MKILILLLFISNSAFGQTDTFKQFIEYREIINNDSTYARTNIHNVNIIIPAVDKSDELIIVYIWNIFFYPTYDIPTRENTTSYRVFETKDGQVFSIIRKPTDDEMNELQE